MGEAEAKEESNKQRESQVSGRVYGFSSSRPDEGSIPRRSKKREGKQDRRWGRFLKPPTLAGRVCFLGLRV